jgi:hypothetical protein
VKSRQKAEHKIVKKKSCSIEKQGGRARESGAGND